MLEVRHADFIALIATEAGRTLADGLAEVREAVDDALREIEATGYGLTLAIHSRIEEFAQEVSRKARVGNVYLNRNMIGAVVGVHPFGGTGLSGTGPKAGAPRYLLRFATERTHSKNLTAQRGNVELFDLQEPWLRVSKSNGCGVSQAHRRMEHRRRPRTYSRR